MQEEALQAGPGEVLHLQTYCCVPRVDCCSIVSLCNRTKIFLFCNSRVSKKNSYQIKQVRLSIRQHLGSLVKLGKYQENCCITWPYDISGVREMTAKKSGRRMTLLVLRYHH